MPVHPAVLAFMLPWVRLVCSAPVEPLVILDLLDALLVRLACSATQVHPGAPRASPDYNLRQPAYTLQLQFAIKTLLPSHSAILSYFLYNSSAPILINLESSAPYSSPTTL